MRLLLADRRGNGIAQVHGAAAFADVVDIPRRDFHFHVAFHHALATQARPEREAGGHLEAVAFFVLIHLGKVLRAFRDDDVAGGAGAVSAAGMFEMYSEVQADIQNRLGLSVLVIGQFSRLEFNRLAVNRYLGHVPL